MSKEKYVGLPRELVRVCAKYTIEHEPVYDPDFVQALSKLMPEWVGCKRKSWTFKELKIEAAKFSVRRKFRIESSAAYSAARKKGVLEVICRHMNAPQRKSWSDAALFAEAKKYTNRADLRRNAPGACRSAFKRGLMKQICAHMGAGRTYRWTDQSLFTEALRFKTRNALKLGAPGAYEALRDKGLLEAACRHMPKVALRTPKVKKAA